MYRESLVASGLANKRYFTIEVTEDGSYLASYHHADDECSTKKWLITSTWWISNISCKSFYIRGEDQSVITALATSQLKESLFYFSINFSGYSFFSQNRLTLCFSDESVANNWRDTLLQTIKSYNKPNIDLLSKGSSESAVCMTELNTEQPPINGTSSSPHGHKKHRRSWQSVHHVNGVAVYAEDGDEEDGGAFMASTIVRVPPQICFDALMRQPAGHRGGELPFSDSTTILEAIDAHTQVIKLSWGPANPMYTWLCSPREMVALRTWRKEPDGTYIILLQSSNHRKARQTTRSSWLPWKSSVRARVEAAGFTVSPLLPQYVPGGGASQECLVTLVIKADLAGGLSPGGIISKIAPMAVDAARWSFLEPLLMSVVMLRDRVEQSRFVVMPYSMAGEEQIEDGVKTDGATVGKGKSATVVAACDEFEGQTKPMAAGNEAGNVDGIGLRRRASKTGQLLGSSMVRTASSLTLGRRKSSVQEETEKSDVRTLGFRAYKTTPPSTPLAHTRDASESFASLNELDGAPSTSETATEEAMVEVDDTNTDTITGESALMAVWQSTGTCEQRFWSYPGSSNLKIRGKNYLEDKVKIPAAPPLFDLYCSDLVDFDEPLWGIAASLPSVQNCTAPFVLVLNLIYPHPSSPLQSLVTVWTAPTDPETEDIEGLVERWGDDEEGTVRAFFTNFKEWMEGEGPEADKRRNGKLKLIPRIVKGSWVVKQGVGTTPVLLGQKLETKYFKGKTANGCKYFEIDTNITSNTVAHSVTKLVVSSITSLIVDLSVLIEGQSKEELPERLIGSVRYEHLDLKTAVGWDQETSSVVSKF